MGNGASIPATEQEALAAGHSQADIDKYKSEWEAAMHRAIDNKTGWTTFDGKVLLANASKAYKQPIFLKEGDPLPINETKKWYETGSGDHWFEIPLDSDKIEEDTGMHITGKLFTTRMPRGIDLAEDEPMSDTISPKHKKQGKTNKRRFIEKVKSNGIKHAVVLVEPEEMVKVQSAKLLQFYESLGMTVHHTPIEDFTVPPLELESANIESLNIALVKGQNCIVHCMGGTGRTGTVVIGAVNNLGFDHPVRHCRQHGKSNYLETAGQEDFLEAHQKVITARMMRECPKLCLKIVFDHLEDLCFENDDGVFDVVDVVGGRSSEEKIALREIFDMVDSAGGKGASRRGDGVVSVNQFLEKLRELCVSQHINPNAFTHLTAENLSALFNMIDPNRENVTLDQDSVTFSLFGKSMDKRPRMASKKMNKKTSKK